MPAFEKRFLLWIDKHLVLLGGIVLGILGLFLRLSLRSLYAVPDDMPDNTFTLFSGFLTAGAGAFVTAKRVQEKRSEKALIVFGVLLLSPAGIFSTVVFGSFGELSVAAAALALYLYGCKRFLLSYLFLALSCGLSVLGLFLLPVFLLLCIREEEHDLLYFLLPLAGAAVRIAAQLGWCSFFGAYLPAGLSESRLYAGFPSFWSFLSGVSLKVWDHYAFGTAAVCIVAVTAFLAFFGKKSLRQTDPFLLALCCGMLVTEFLPGLDPAAGSVTLLVWFAVVSDVRLLIPAILLELITLFPLAAALYGEEWQPLSTQWLAVLRFLLFLFLLFLAGKKKGLDERKKV